MRAELPRSSLDYCRRIQGAAEIETFVLLLAVLCKSYTAWQYGSYQVVRLMYCYVKD